MLKGYTVNVIFATQYKENFPLIREMVCNGPKEITFDTTNKEKLRNDVYVFFLDLENKLWTKENNSKSKRCNINVNMYEKKGKAIMNSLIEKTTIKQGTTEIQSYGFIISNKGRIVTGAVNGDLVGKYFDLDFK